MSSAVRCFKLGLLLLVVSFSSMYWYSSGKLGMLIGFVKEDEVVTLFMHSSKMLAYISLLKDLEYK